MPDLQTIISSTAVAATQTSTNSSNFNEFFFPRSTTREVEQWNLKIKIATSQSTPQISPGMPQMPPGMPQMPPGMPQPGKRDIIEVPKHPN